LELRNPGWLAVEPKRGHADEGIMSSELQLGLRRTIAQDIDTYFSDLSDIIPFGE
jgi:hypothetical protein